MQEKFLYWISQRESIRLKKEAGIGKPWTTDTILQQTYFCNVRREHDRVTRFIRATYSPYVTREMFEYNIILSRFLNWPDTLRYIGYQFHHDPYELEHKLAAVGKRGKVWGGAYIITTHGIKMGKAAYLCHRVMDGVWSAIRTPGSALLRACRHVGGTSCQNAYMALQSLEGLGSFLAAQVVADLKNTVGHPLYEANDKQTFVAHGPGSIRGLQWFWDDKYHITAATFYRCFYEAKEIIEANWSEESGPPICAQDLQNCFCEFDKYMRVSTGSGRSKRAYPGLA